MPSPDQLSSPSEPFFTRFNKTHDDADRRRAENAAAAEMGLWALADIHMPSDVREAAQRWKLGTAMEELWRSAFIAGWREHERVKADRSPSPTEGDGNG